MGYNTNFSGTLKVTTKRPMTSDEIDYLNFEVLNVDVRETPEWNNIYLPSFKEYVKELQLTYIDLEFNEDQNILYWNGSEKTYDLPEKTDLVIQVMNQKFPDLDFVVNGELLAQGEESGDIWKLIVKDNHVTIQKAKITFE